MHQGERKRTGVGKKGKESASVCVCARVCARVCVSVCVCALIGTLENGGIVCALLDMYCKLCKYLFSLKQNKTN